MRAYSEANAWFDPERSLEFYLNNPDSTEPEDLLTEVCVRITE